MKHHVRNFLRSLSVLTGMWVLASLGTTANAQCLITTQPTASSCSSTDNITSFTMASITTTTPCGTSPAGYTFLPTPVRNLTIGQSYTWSATTGSLSQRFVFWIDLNNNGQLETTEAFNTGQAAATSHSGTITIPLTATPGTNVRMRIRCRWSTQLAPGDACLNYSWGETEDYNVNLISATPCAGQPNAGAATATPTSFTCSGAPALNMTGSSTGSGLTYTWQSGPSSTGPWTNVAGGVGLSAPAFTAPAISATTWYQVITTCTPSGQSNTSSPVQVTINSTILPGSIAAAPSQSTYCGTASPTLTLSGHTATGTTIQWQSSPTGAVWTNVGTNATTYAVPGITSSMLYRALVTCTASSTTVTAGPILINVAPNPVVGISPSTAAICSGSSTTLTGTGAATYSWSPGGATTPSITVSPTSTTTYTVTGTLGGCTATGTSTVSVGTPFTAGVIANPTAVCVGGSTVLSATAPVPSSGAYCVPPYSTGTTSNDYIQSVVMPTTTLNNVSGDDGDQEYVVYPQSGSTTATLTAGSTYTLTTTVGPVGSQRVAVWIDYNSNGVLDNTGELVAPISGAIAGNSSHTITFTVPAGTLNGTHRMRVRCVWGSSGNTQTPCSSASFGQAEDYNITIVGGVDYVATTPYVVNWTESVGSTTLASTTANPVTASNINVNKTYSVTVSRDGCTSTASVTVNANPLPTATMTTTTPTICAGEQPSITITGTPNSNVVYSINGTNQPAVSTGGSGSVTFSAPAISVNTAYALVSATTPATTCTNTLSGGFTVNVNERPAGIFLGTSTVCKDQPAFIGFGSPSGASVFPIYVTFTDGTNTYLDTAYGAGENFPVPSDVPGMYNYTLVSLTSGNSGCAALPSDMSGTAVMEIKALPTAVVTSSVPGVCAGGNADITLTFTGDAPFNFNYFDGTITQGGSSMTNTFTFNSTITTTTNYYVENLLDNNFCVATPADLADTATVVVYDTTTITSQPIAAITTCSETDAIITMTATGENLTYTWYENGVALVAGPNYVINNNILTINNVTGLDGNQYYVVVHSDCGNDQTSNSTTINEDHSNNWSGAVDSDWDDPMNWSCGVVPIVTTDVFVQGNLANQPIVNIPTAVCRDFTLFGVNGAGSLTFQPAMQLSVYGDIDNTTGGTIDGSGAKIVLAGTVQNASGPLTLNDLDVTGGGVKTFTNDVTVNGILNLVNGNIELGTANLTVVQPSSVAGGSPTSFIVTNGTGKVTGNNMGAIGGNAAPATFHVGINNTSYTPVTLENLGDADNFSVRVMEHVYEDGTGVIPTLVDNPVVDRTWLVEEATTGGSVVTMTPSWNSPVDEINGFVQTNVFVAHHMGGDWTSTVGTSTNAPAAVPGVFTGMWQTSEDSIMTFSPFTVASTGQFPLSIHLSSIVAVNVGARNKVQWTSAKEDAGDKYELESSADGRTFTKIATMAAKGEASSYLQWDEQPVQGVNYYRVKLLNNDGTFSYSKIVTATVNGKDGFSIEAYPNPVKTTVSVKIDGVVAANAKVVVTDVTGKVVKAATSVVNNGAEINVSDLAAGVYLLNYSDDVRSESIKINKQ